MKQNHLTISKAIAEMVMALREPGPVQRRGWPTEIIVEYPGGMKGSFTWPAGGGE